MEYAEFDMTADDIFEKDHQAPMNLILEVLKKKPMTAKEIQDEFEDMDMMPYIIHRCLHHLVKREKIIEKSIREAGNPQEKIYFGLPKTSR